MSDEMRNVHAIRIATALGTQYNGRTDGRTNEESHQVASHLTAVDAGARSDECAKMNQPGEVVEHLPGLTTHLSNQEGAGAIMAATRTCNIAGCDKPVRSTNADWCNTHYFRWYRNGDPEGLAPPRSVDLAGQRFGTLVASHRLDAAHWLCICDCGRERRVRTWSLTSGGTRTCMKGHRRLPVVNYFAAHERIARDRGPARLRPCVDCGRRAQQWSYRHDDPNELIGAEGAYSLTSDHYDPRCVSCHKRFDLARLASA